MSLQLLDLLLRPFFPRINLPENRLRSGDLSSQQQPTRTLRYNKQNDEKQECRQSFHTQHTSPNFIDKYPIHQLAIESHALRDTQQPIINKVCSQKTDGNSQLIQRNQPAPILGYRYFRDIHRRNNRNDTDSYSTDNTIKNKPLITSTQCTANGRNRKHNRRENHRQPTTYPIAHRPSHGNPGDRTYKSTPHIPTLFYII